MRLAIIKEINSNKYNKQNWIWEKKGKMSLVPVGNTNRYQMAATLRQRDCLFGTGWSFQPVPMEAKGTG